MLVKSVTTTVRANNRALISIAQLKIQAQIIDRSIPVAALTIEYKRKILFSEKNKPFRHDKATSFRRSISCSSDLMWHLVERGEEYLVGFPGRLDKSNKIDMK